MFTQIISAKSPTAMIVTPRKRAERATTLVSEALQSDGCGSPAATARFANVPTLQLAPIMIAGRIMHPVHKPHHNRAT